MMRDIWKYLGLPMLTLLVGGVGMAWWTDSHPKTQVFYDVQTNALLSDPSETKYDCVTRVSVWNPSHRVTSTDLSLRIRLPTTQRVRIGRVVTPEAPETIYVQGTEAREVYRREAAGSSEGSRAALTIIVGDPPDLPDDAELGHATVSVQAERLVPGSDMIIPIWWNSAEQEPDVAVVGTAYECKLIRQDRTTATGPGVTSSRVAAAVLISVLVGLMGFSAGRGVAQSRTFHRLQSENAELHQKLASLTLKTTDFEHRLRKLRELD